MKKLVLLSCIICTVALSSCTMQKQDDRFFCKKLGFDMENEKIHVTVLLSSSGKDTPEGEEERVLTRVAKNSEQAIELLTNELENILFKPLEVIIFGQTVDEKTVSELTAKIANRVEFQLKCDVVYAFDAKDAILRKIETDENEGVVFSRFFRGMTGGKNDGEQ